MLSKRLTKNKTESKQHANLADLFRCVFSSNEMNDQLSIRIHNVVTLHSNTAVISISVIIYSVYTFNYQ